MSALVILACSGRKRPAPAPVPAAEHGLIVGDRPITTYDRRMDARRAATLRPAVLQAALQLFGAPRPTRVAVVAGKHYRHALADCWALFGSATLRIPAGGIGSKMAALKGWLEGL